MRHIFLVSYGRSGSTVLQNLLNMIPGFCIRGENGGVLPELVEAIRRLEESKDSRPSKRDQRDPWFGIRESDPGAFRNALADAFVRTVLAPPPDCRATGFKEIRYIPIDISAESFTASMEFMLTSFDNARIIFNTRDPAEVAGSSWWTDWSYDEVCREVATATARFVEVHKSHPDSTFLIDHSDYDGKPEGFLPLLEWLGEDLPRDQLKKVSEDRLTHSSRRAGLRRFSHVFRALRTSAEQ